MKMLTKSLLALLGTASSLLGADGLTVSAQIDGVSQLIIRRDQIHWQHILFARPGKHLGDFPTLINGYAWYPQWPDSNPSGPAPSAPLIVNTEFSTNEVVLEKTAGRGVVSIIQQPSVANDFTLIISFDDAAADGPDRYSITLSGVTVAVLPRLSAQVACIALSWPTETNHLYQLQYSSLLTSNTWVDLSTPIRGYGTNALYIDSAFDGPRRFYRVIPLP